MKDNNQHIDNIIQQKAINHPITFDENNWDKMEDLLDTHLPIAQTGGSLVTRTTFLKKLTSFFLPVVATIGLSYLVWNANVNQSVTTDVLNAQPVSPQSLTHENTSHTTGIEKTTDSPNAMVTVKEANNLEINKTGLEKVAATKDISIQQTANTIKQNKSFKEIDVQQKTSKKSALSTTKTNPTKQRVFNKIEAKQSTDVAKSSFAKPITNTFQNSTWNNINKVKQTTDFSIDNTQNTNQNKVVNTASSIAKNGQAFKNIIDNQRYIVPNDDLLNKKVEENITTELSDRIMTKQLIMPLLPKEGLVELEEPLALDEKPFPKQKWKRLSLGLLGGINTRMLAFNNQFSLLPFGGIWFDYQIGRKLHLEIRPQYILLDVQYNQFGKNGTGFIAEFTHERFTDDRDYITYFLVTDALHYIQMPVILKYQLGKKINAIFTGVHLAYLLPNHTSYTGASSAWVGEHPPLPESNKSGLQKFDIGLIMGFQKTIHPKWKLDVRYTQGMFDITHDNWFKKTDTHVTSDLQVSLMYQIW